MADDDDQFALGAVSAEYFALQSLRASSISESSARASLFFTAITGTLVALGLLSNSLPHSQLVWVAVGASPVLGFVGLTSFLRITETSIEDVAALRAMNTLRMWMVTTAPQLGALIRVQTRPDQPSNEFVNTGARESPLRILFTLGSTVGTVNSAQLAVASGLVLNIVGLPPTASLLVAAALGTGLLYLHARYQLRRFVRAITAWGRESTQAPGATRSTPPPSP